MVNQYKCFGEESGKKFQERKKKSVSFDPAVLLLGNYFKEIINSKAVGRWRKTLCTKFCYCSAFYVSKRPDHLNVQ